MDIRLADLLGIVQNGGWVAVPGILLFIVWTNLRGDWRPKREYVALEHDRDEWKAAAKLAVANDTAKAEQISKLTAIVESLTDSLARGRTK